VYRVGNFLCLSHTVFFEVIEMNSKFIIKMAMTSAVVAVPSVGWNSLGLDDALNASTPDAGLKKAHNWARKAEKLMAKGNYVKALGYAEMAVEADMNNRDYRAQLARIYMAQGRFQSAERTLMDVMELGQVDPRTVVSLSLTRIAQGNVDSALSLIEANRSIISASDYGLTLALAGQSKQAVDVLVEAIRSDNATARTRQNLALAYALDGRWREARIMAVQDMPEVMVNKYIAEWAQYARPGAYEMRVAGLLKVTPQIDAGQPVRLALAGVPANLAQAEPVSSPVSVAYNAPVEELSAIGPAPASVSAGFSAPEVDAKIAAIEVEPSKPAVEAPLIKAQTGPAKAVGAAVAAPKPVKLAMADVAPKRAVSGTHLIQLGAFSSSASAQAAWSQYTKRYGVLQDFSSASSTVVVNGKTLIRLAAMGFGNQASAVSVCRSIQAKGGACIVRSTSGGAPVRMAAASGRKVAVR
jgi:D-alanyl-D-alanine carboxypeptidase